jgi:hypothetical protein
MQAYGLMLCEIEDYKNLIYNNKTVFCNDTINAYLEKDGSSLSVYYEPTNPDQRLYLISAAPPRVFEFDIENFRNTMITKIYATQTAASSRFIALP